MTLPAPAEPIKLPWRPFSIPVSESPSPIRLKLLLGSTRPMTSPADVPEPLPQTFPAMIVLPRMATDVENPSPGGFGWTLRPPPAWSGVDVGADASFAVIVQSVTTRLHR